MRGPAVARGAGRGPAVGRGPAGRGMPVGASPSVLELSPVWAVDASRYGGSGLWGDLVGDADVTGSNDNVTVYPGAIPAQFLRPPADALRSVAVQNYEGTGPSDSSGWTTPHDAAMYPSATLSVRAGGGFRAISDPQNLPSGPERFAIARKAIADDFGNDLVVAINDTAEVEVQWSDGVDQHTIAAGSIDWFDPPTLRADLDLATGDLTVYTSADDGDTWTEADTTAGDGPVTIAEGTEPLVACPGRGVYGWVEWWADGVLVASFDAADGEPWATTVTSTTGETWTAHATSILWPAGEPQFVGTHLMVPDDPAVDIGTGDFTVAVRMSMAAVASGGAFYNLFHKADPATIGSGGVGWGLFDYAPLGGLVFLVNDGTGLVFAGSAWTAQEFHTIAVTGDRDGLLSLYVDDMATPAATADLSATTGTLANTLPVYANPHGVTNAITGAAIFDRVLDGGELTRLPTLMGV